MATGKLAPHCEFDRLFKRNVPHILEKIFFTLDYDSFMACGKVCMAWGELHASKSYQQKAGKLQVEKRENEVMFIRFLQTGNVEEVQRLLRRGVNPNSETFSLWEKPLYNAALSGNNELTKLLLKFGADPNIENSGRQTPLHIASREGNHELVKQLIDGGATLDKMDTYGDTPLILAVKSGQQETVELLLHAGADPNRDNPLCNAARSGNNELTKLLLKFGADPNIENSQRETPLRCAAIQGNHELVKQLIDGGATISKSFKIRNCKISYQFR